MAKQVHSDLDFLNTTKIVNLPDPTDPQHPVTKAYADAISQAISWKDNVRAASTANVNIASPGASLDGVTLVSGDRILLKDQSTASQNGIYIWNSDVTPATRALDADLGSELLMAVVGVDEGTANADTMWRCDTVAITIGSTSISFVSFQTSVPAASTTTAGVAELATQGEVDGLAATDKIITPETLGNWSGRAKKIAFAVGDASATQFDLSHNFNTRDVTVEVYRNSGNYDSILCEVGRLDVNTVRLNFTSAPASNAFRCVIQA